MKSFGDLARAPVRFRRRSFLTAALAAFGLPVYATAIEPGWLRVRHLTLPQHPFFTGRPVRWAQFTDVHYKGDGARLDHAIDCINELAPDFACFTGDLIEESWELEAALAGIQRIRCPLFGVPGNHDHWAFADFSKCRTTFAATGGAWLMDEIVDLPDLPIRVIGLDNRYSRPRPDPDRFNLVLMHYPIWANDLPYRSDLLLAGHSHGGQVRVPGFGPLILPEETGGYDLGMFDTPSGPLYVNPGLGTFYLDVRFYCRPELTCFEIGET
jgi:predicted MPP superfamily phosphohydrolase